MTENERIKEVRKAHGMTLESFGAKIGVTRSAMSNIENGIRGVTDQMRRSICREFGINEEWLRDGTGQMEATASGVELDAIAAAHNATDLERRLVRAYFELDEETRRKVMGVLKATILADDAREKEAEREQAEIEAEVESYRQQLLEERGIQASQDSSQSSGGGKLA